MLFKKKKSTPPTDKRISPTVMSGQRVNSYYTASKKQITTFQRHTDAAQVSKSSFKTKIKHYGAVALGGGLLLIVIIAMLTLNTSASISIDQGGAYRSPEEYKTIVTNALGTSIVNRFKPSLQSDVVENQLKETLPEAMTVAVYAPLFGRNPEVIITTAAPFAVLLQDGGPTLLMSNRGRLVIDSGKSNVDTSKLPTITNQSGTMYQTGDQLFKPEEMAALIELQYQFTQGSGEGAIAYILPPAPREIHTKEGLYIAKFSLNEDANITQQFGALRAVQGQLQSQNKTPTEYVDVRLATKVFIK